MMAWKAGRGKLGIFAPLLGTWVAEADSERGPLKCTRTFTQILDGKYIELRAHWAFANSAYEELALFGVGEDKTVNFWSFTSDGKRSAGSLADVSDLHPEAVGFEAQMPSGLARQAYWPHPDEGFEWVVESRTKKGWNRFVLHHYMQ
jgi:hypothetical protein